MTQTEESKKKDKKKKKHDLDLIETETKVIEEEFEEPAKKPKKKKKKKDKNEAEESFDNQTKEDDSKITEEPPKKKKKKNKNKSADQEDSKFPKKEVPQSIKDYFLKHSIKVYGRECDSVSPFFSFSDLSSIDERVKSIVEGFETPTPIQAMTWPVSTSGRDVIGIAETGSGKTLAFSIPGLDHVLKISSSKGPFMLVLAPTRELAMQSQEVLVKAGASCGLKSACVYGGVPKYEQRTALRSGVHILVATPGRLIDLMEEEVCDLSKVSYLVLDEADRMLDQGFERAIRTIISKTKNKENRQTCLFSATWPDSIRELAHDFLIDPIKVTIGSEDLAAGKTVTQIVEVVDERGRETKLLTLLKKYHKNNNRILVFVLYKKEAERIYQYLVRQNLNVGSIHGDKSQNARIQAVDDFKKGTVPILIATDVAARGLDIPGVEYVINYSFPLTIEDYVHRIGRTGRAGKSGVAHTFFHQGDKARAGELVNVLKESKQEVPKEMYKFDLSVKRKEHKLYGAFGPKSHDTELSSKKSTRIVFDD